ncbi:phosphatidylinositol N-acetylglucosaminyltransferase subunit Q-like protein [Leptotrombidium deliense]|uniref:Phosphatidylinositol N-acetylglucosaminyltransferase subunit Q-like protein n=1 Tax=Leptotrombidium deliense TaxID=299467 RepID=A0A443SQF6_9ACAR|nr:phosphatidylinositol N-acetylglucosaminyltransferase subunit Q-like protein [Leptotrombidium deliense]
MKIMRWTTTGSQLSYRINQMHFCYYVFVKHKRSHSLIARNIIFSILFDIFVGILFVSTFMYFSRQWLNCGLFYAETVVNNVEQLLHYLISMPVGLKLNRPLNQALGHFFEYHIHIWKTYISIVTPIFDVIADILTFCSLFGFTCILSLLSDLLSLITIHIYCFYGYATRLYGFQASSLWSLWRLFRGKKWNQLKHRVDSYSYGNDQLFIGTLTFTILIFLLPTVLLYYLVFLVLRLIILSVKLLLKFTITKFCEIPVYSIYLWIVNSRDLKGRVHFKLISTKSGATKLCVEFKRMPFCDVFNVTQLPIENPLQLHLLSMFEFVNSVFWGKIIYPL